MTFEAMPTVTSHITAAPILLLEIVKPLSRTFTPSPAREGLASAPAVGTVLGPWLIEGALGSGAMGQVYQATHERLGRRVALKVLRPELVGEVGLVERFLQEGRAVNQINHEHIVEVHDFVHQHDTVYCVMEFLEGETLATRMARRPSSLDSIRSMAAQIASALGAAHAAGVVHRDLKPENIFLVSRDGRDDWVKVIDFGIAKCAPPDGGLSTVQTAQGSVLGTPRYMAPEQVTGEELGFRTDLFAAGAILFEMLAGHPAFGGKTVVEVLYATLHEQPPALSGSAAVAAADRVLRKALAKAPKDRHATAEAMAADLRAVLQAEGLIVVTPEYNGSLPGVLKYFIDMLKFPESFEQRPV